MANLTKREIAILRGKIDAPPLEMRSAEKNLDRFQQQKTSGEHISEINKFIPLAVRVADYQVSLDRKKQSKNWSRIFCAEMNRLCVKNGLRTC